jgi:putative oxidoreductase
MYNQLISTAPLNRDVGLLLIRLGIGCSMLVFHGWGKLTGGTELWTMVGGNMSNLGITFAPAFWGFMAAFAEAVCSALLILGLFFRPAAALLAFTMLVAITRHLNIPEGEPGAGWKGASHALELFSVYVGLVAAGAGRYTVLRRGPRESGDTAAVS